MKNENYWDKVRVPKVDKMLLLPMPEATLRTAALLSGQVDWIEAPAPDTVPQLKKRGFVIDANSSPTSGRGSSRASKARHGMTFAFARPPTSASTATTCMACSSA